MFKRWLIVMLFTSPQEQSYNLPESVEKRRHAKTEILRVISSAHPRVLA